MKRIVILMLLLGLLLTGCAKSEPTQQTEPPTTEAAETAAPETTVPETTVPETEAPEETEPPKPNITAVYTYCTDDSQEFAQVAGLDEAGEQVWMYETAHLDMAQLYRVSDIGVWEDRYYIVEDGAVVALDLATGQVLWRNGEFCGSPAGADAAVIDELGTVYLCGFFGPDLFIVDCEGTTVQNSSVLDPDYYWGHKLTVAENTVTVFFSGGPEGDMGPEAYWVDVELS